MLNSQDKVGMFTATLYCHTVREPVMLHCISVYICRIVVDSKRALILILSIVATTWLIVTSGGWLCSLDCTVVSWIVTSAGHRLLHLSHLQNHYISLTTFIGSWSRGSWLCRSWPCGSWFHDSWSRGLEPKQHSRWGSTWEIILFQQQLACSDDISTTKILENYLPSQSCFTT